MAGSSYALMVVFVLVLGIGYGGFVALGPIVISDHLGVTGLGSILGIFYTAPGLGGLIGPPSAGWLIDRTDSYTPAILVAFACGVVAFTLLHTLPIGPTVVSHDRPTSWPTIDPSIDPSAKRLTPPPPEPGLHL